MGDPGSARAILLELGVRPSKALGQNFLIQPQTSRKIAASAAVPCATAFEIGPGLGALTEALLERAESVISVEIDRRLCEYLRGRFAGRSGFRLIESDALTLDWETALSETSALRIVFGNLPYVTSAPLIEKIFQHSPLFSDAILCLQSEVADRLTSSGGRGMGPLTILAHRFCSRREKLFRIPPGGFWPNPKVTSTVVHLQLRPAVSWSESDRVIPRALFAHRRKKLSSVVPPDILIGLRGSKGDALESRRIDELSVDEVMELADRMRARSV